MRDGVESTYDGRMSAPGIDRRMPLITRGMGLSVGGCRPIAG